MHLFGFEILFDSARRQLTAKARLFVAAPRSFHIYGLGVVHPHDSRTHRLDYSQSAIDVTRPNGSRESVLTIVRDSNGVCLILEGNDCRDRPENLFPGNSCAVVD